MVAYVKRKYQMSSIEFERQVKNWMFYHQNNYDNSTELAENACWENDCDSWLDDPDHWIWDYALELIPGI